MALRNQTLWEPKKYRYLGFVNYGMEFHVLTNLTLQHPRLMCSYRLELKANGNARLATSLLTKSHQSQTQLNKHCTVKSS